MSRALRVVEGETDDQQLGFEHFIADVEDSNVEFKQSQKVRLCSKGGYRLTIRTAHARNLIQRGCRMLNCSNCRNGYLRIQRIGSSRRSRPLGISMEYHEKTGYRRESIMEKTGQRRGERTGTLWKRERRRAKRTAR
jgi:hypothetical protein